MQIVDSKNAKATLVFVHGGPGMDESYFLPFFKPLSDSVRLVLYKQSADPGLGMPGLLKELEAVIQQISDRPVFLLGHSFGSMLAIEYLTSLPSQSKVVRGLVLMSWIYDVEWLNHFNEKAKLRNLGAALPMGSEDPNAKYRRETLEHADMYFHGGSVTVGKNLLGRIAYDAYASDLLWKNYLQESNLKPALSSIDIPVLSIAGDCDQVVSASYISSGANGIRNCRHITLDHAGHFPFVEQPQLTLEAIRKFINQTLEETL